MNMDLFLIKQMIKSLLLVNYFAKTYKYHDFWQLHSRHLFSVTELRFLSVTTRGRGPLLFEREEREERAAKNRGVEA